MAPISDIKEPFEIVDYNNSCETYFFFDSVSPTVRSVIPEASADFRLALASEKAAKKDSSDTDSSEDEKRLPAKKSVKSTQETASKSSVPSPFRSLSQSLKKLASPRSKFLSVPTSLPQSSSPSSSSSSSHKADSEDSGAHKTIAGVSLRRKPNRRAASFSTGDAEKMESRHNQEKRVSWADERGSKCSLINVRLIRPRLSMDTCIPVSSKPGHSILRKVGAK